MRADLAQLSVARVGASLTREATESLAHSILAAFNGAVERLRIVDLDPPPIERVAAPLLTRVLADQIGGHVLGVTDADLVDPSGEDFFSFLFGGKDQGNHVAVVSTHRLTGADPELGPARLAKIALHEVGHNFGLVHHYSFVPAASGPGCCPMSKGDFNRHGETSYLRSVVDARGLRFCAACRDFLRIRWT